MNKLRLCNFCQHTWTQLCPLFGVMRVFHPDHVKQLHNWYIYSRRPFLNELNKEDHERDGVWLLCRFLPHKDPRRAFVPFRLIEYLTQLPVSMGLLVVHFISLPPYVCFMLETLTIYTFCVWYFDGILITVPTRQASSQMCWWNKVRAERREGRSASPCAWLIVDCGGSSEK